VRKKTATAAIAALAFSTLSVVGASPANADNIGNEGCTPGYWKNHTSNWEEYSPTQTLGVVFNLPDALAKYRNVTLIDALSLKGGPGVDGGAQILLRAAVAAKLNAAHEGLGYPLRREVEPGRIRFRINTALNSLDRGTMISLATELDGYNNLGCPLN
jgi:hypothetical protein